MKSKLKDSNLKAVVIEHLPFENAGIFGEVLTEEGIEFKRVSAPTEALDPAWDADLLLVMGGPISCNDDLRFPFLRTEISLLEQRIHHKKPTLGVCLGAQLIAKAMGAEIYPIKMKEIGWSSVTLTPAGKNSPLAELTEPVLHWHGEMFDIPEGCENLASTTKCPNQAFAVAEHTLALQFHAEVAQRILEQWLVGHVNELDLDEISINMLRSDSLHLGARCIESGKRMFRRWLHQLKFDQL